MSEPSVLAELLREATELHQQGRLDEAERLYSRLLDHDPRQFDALNRRAIVALQRGDFEEALRRVDLALRVRPNSEAATSNKGTILISLKRYGEALAAYDRVIDLDSHDGDAHYNRGNALKELRRPEDALASYDKAIALRPDDAAAYSNRGTVLVDLKRLDEGLASFDKAIALDPGYADAYCNRGIALVDLERFDEGLASFDKAIALNPSYADAYYNRGLALVDLERFDEGLASLDKAIALNPSYADAYYNRGIALFGLKRLDEALASYDKAIALDPSHVDAYGNRGNALKELRRPVEALASYDKAIALRPDDADAYYNRGAVLVDLKRLDEALASYDKAIALDPSYADAYCNRGVVLVDLKRFDEALASYDKAITIEPDNVYVFNNLANAAVLCCDWAKAQQIAQVLDQKIAQNHSVIEPFVTLEYSAGPAIQLNAARNYIRQRIPRCPPPMCQGTRYRHEKIRVAYLSADYRVHPIAYLVAELFELHDRRRFEVVGVSFGPNDGSPERARLMNAFDRFHDVRDLSDAGTAKLLRDGEIDIAVDITGITRECRPEILAFRPAPIQVSYLGYPGTTGADFIDYVIADPTVLPFEQSAFYTEKIVHLPDCYLVNDRKREISPTTPTRKAAGLPETGFVFCCFNTNYKITPQVFDIWMRLMRELEGSVLWLSQNNEPARRNLCAEAEARGVSSTRLVFAGRLPLYQEHLARHRLADLFLDTLPYNAHTTASDALWAGLPVITCLGEAFPGRVAASLLRAVGLPELVTKTPVEYEELARRLASTPMELRSVREKLGKNRLTCALFDTKRFVHHIEAAYVHMRDRAERGLPPESFSVRALSPPSSGT